MVVMAMMVVVVLWRKERKSSTRLVFFFCKSLSPFSRGSARKGAKCKVEDDLKVDQRKEALLSRAVEELLLFTSGTQSP